MTEDVNIESDDDADELIEEQLIWRMNSEHVESLQLKKPIDLVSVSFGTTFYEITRVLTYSAPVSASLGKGTTGTYLIYNSKYIHSVNTHIHMLTHNAGRLPISLLYGGLGTIKIGVENSSGGCSWRFKIGWEHIHCIKFDGTTCVLETTQPMDIMAQPMSKGKHMTHVDGSEVGTNLRFVAHVIMKFQSAIDVKKFTSGLEAMGKPGMLSAAISRTMFLDERLDNQNAIERQKSLKAQSDPIGAFIRGETLPLLLHRQRMYDTTQPDRIHIRGNRTMAPGSGRSFFRECSACRTRPCSGCGGSQHRIVWIADNGSLESEGGVDHQTCPTTYKDPRTSNPIPERCSCGIDVATRARDMFILMDVTESYMNTI